MIEREMSDIDLSAMKREELDQLRKDIDKAIETYDERQRLEALKAARQAAHAAGYTLEELIGSSKKAKGKKTQTVPKYRHPENPALTWSGRGRQPEWFKAAVEAGTPKDEMLIA
jgi:DNA-binding protein H-NS